MRTPTSERPAVTLAGTSGPRGKSRVRGPGQKASIRPAALGGISAATRESICRSETCTISGSHDGRCLATKIFPTASGSRALAPSPYTVSVGNATVPPLRRIEAAWASAARDDSAWRSAESILNNNVFTEDSRFNPARCTRSRGRGGRAGSRRSSGCIQEMLGRRCRSPSRAGRRRRPGR